MPDRIAPPAARQPAEVVELVSAAMSDGDLEAALAQYEPGALLLPWASRAAESGGSAKYLLDQLMELRLPLSVLVYRVLEVGDLALLLVRRDMCGRSADGQHVALSGHGATMARRLPGGPWLIVVDAWQLSEIDEVVF
ncbi:MAG TPA: hypothetical protein VMA95_05825 [Streptosporangiaceae bacterium]|nr:hypothetical protein [Streptosporangiaceae bacterium]